MTKTVITASDASWNTTVSNNFIANYSVPWGTEYPQSASIIWMDDLSVDGSNNVISLSSPIATWVFISNNTNTNNANPNVGDIIYDFNPTIDKINLPACENSVFSGKSNYLFINAESNQTPTDLAPQLGAFPSWTSTTSPNPYLVINIGDVGNGSLQSVLARVNQVYKPWNQAGENAEFLGHVTQTTAFASAGDTVIYELGSYKLLTTGTYAPVNNPIGADGKVDTLNYIADIVGVSPDQLSAINFDNSNQIPQSIIASNTVTTAGPIVTVNPHAPVAQTIGMQTWTLGQSVTLATSMSDPQGYSVTYAAITDVGNGTPIANDPGRYSINGLGLSINPTTGLITGTISTAVNIGTIEVTGTDSFGNATVIDILFKSSSQNLAPVGPAITSETLVFGKSVDSSLAFSDPQNQSMTYNASLSGGATLSSLGLSFNAATGLLTGTPTKTGSYTLNITATDSSAHSGQASVILDITKSAPPSVGPMIAAQTWEAGIASQFAVPAGSFADAAGLTLTYSASVTGGASLPNWLTFNAATQTFSGTAPLASSPLVENLTVTATDPAGQSASQTFTLVADQPSSPILVSQTPSLSIGTGQAFSFTIPAGTFSDPQGQSLSLSTLNLPSWLTFNANTNTLSGTAPDAPETDSIDIIASDQSGLAVGEYLSLTVLPVQVTLPSPTLAHQEANQAVKDGQKFSFHLAADSFTDPNGLALTYSATFISGEKLPSWLSFDPYTGIFSGTAPKSGSTTTEIEITAADTAGYSATETFSLLNAQKPAETPTLTDPEGNLTFQATKPLKFALPTDSFTGPIGQALTNTATLQDGKKLPAWLTFNAATETFSGTPPASEAGQSLAIEITAKTPTGQASTEDFTLSITAKSANTGPEVVLPAASHTEQAGKAFHFALPAGGFSDNEAMTYTATLSTGQSLPSWLSFNAKTETFSGTAPMAENLDLTVTATDKTGAHASETFALIATDGAPVLTDPTSTETVTPGQTFQFALPSNTFSETPDQHATITATLKSGAALPDWVSFDANNLTFSGAGPNSTRTIDITVTETNSFGSASETFALTDSSKAAAIHLIGVTHDAASL